MPKAIYSQVVSYVRCLQVNHQKTKVIVFRNDGHLADHEKWILGPTRLETVNEYRYLGALFTTRLSFNSMQSDLVQRAKGAMMQVSRCLQKLDCMSPDVYFKIRCSGTVI